MEGAAGPPIPSGLMVRQAAGWKSLLSNPFSHFYLSVKRPIIAPENP